MPIEKFYYILVLTVSAFLFLFYLLRALKTVGVSDSKI